VYFVVVTVTISLVKLTIR